MHATIRIHADPSTHASPASMAAGLAAAALGALAIAVWGVCVLSAAPNAADANAGATVSPTVRTAHLSR
jgi:hypothetical protein